MTYIPVGTILTYTAQVSTALLSYSGFNNWETLAAKLKFDLPNLPGMEELDVSSTNGSTSLFGSFSGDFNISLEILNNGVDHGSETDIQSIIDGTIQGYGNQLLGSNIIVKALPNNATDDQNNRIVINNPNVTQNAPNPGGGGGGGGGSGSGDKPFSLAAFLGLDKLAAGTKATISITLIIIVIVIIVLLLPGNARRLVGG